MKLVSIANSLIAASSENIHCTAGKVLELTGETVRADLAYLYFYDKNKSMAVNTHQWHLEGSGTIPRSCRQIPFDEISGVIRLHLNNRPLIMPPIIPGCEKAALLFTFKSQKTRFVALFPLFVEGRCYGFIGCNHTRSIGRPRGELQVILGAVAGMLARALVRCRKEAAHAGRFKGLSF